MNHELNKQVMQILDCTIRDGGYINNWDFPIQMVQDIYVRLSRAGVDFVEIGFRDSNPDSPLWRRCPEDLLYKITERIHGAKLAVMVDFGKAGPEQFNPARESAIDLVRVASHRNKISQALTLIREIKQKGYLTSIQLMGYPQYSADERDDVLRLLKDCYADYVYVADSYGSLMPDQVEELLGPLVDLNLFKVGFHPHNNLQLAFANTLEAMKAGVDVIDCTLYGMGRGPGNVPTEVLLTYLGPKNRDKLNANHALYCVDMYLLPLRKEYEWGYQLPFMLSGSCECHPYYAKELIDARRYTIEDVWKALRIVKSRNPIGFDKKMLQSIMDSGDFEYNMMEATPGSSEPVYTKTSSPQIPSYIDKHKGKSFLVLANGPSLKECASDIRAFIKKYDPVILGANYLGDCVKPHYHAFMNKKRFAQYVHTVSPDSNLLLSTFFSDELIQEYTDREYEKIIFRHGDRNKLTIYDGVISNDCTSVSMLLVAVASVMGAKEVYVAGMDGYEADSGQKKAYFYDEKNDSSSLGFNKLRHQWGTRTLAILDNYLIQSGRSGVNIITPTAYEKYYRGIKSLI